MSKFDFSGYATRNDLKCTDGRTIRKDAFKENDGLIVPLVWQHKHDEPSNVLGHALLENREDGVYTFGKFNDTESGKNAKLLVEHGDITALSIFANGLVQKGADVLHGAIREVSLVMAGANPGAMIDNFSIQHGDGSYSTDETEAVIYTGTEFSLTELEHEEKKKDMGDQKKEDERTVEDVFNTLTEEQQSVVYFMIGAAIEEAGKETPAAKTGSEDTVEHSDLGGNKMKKNIFENDPENNVVKNTLTHAQIADIFADAQKCGSFKEAFLAHAVTYGIENIDFLFPDAKTITDSPDFVSRRMEWVSSVISGAKHSPFSRIKSLSADLTLADARAKGYVTGALKKEEFFALSKRITTPTTIYKKQKLDRDDIIDITDLDVVAWLKAEMRIMLDEELGRAVLIGDGREADDADKINETNIRPIAKEDNFYAHRIELAANTSGASLVESILRNRTFYKGSGNPTLFTTETILTDLLLVKDKIGRRLYPTVTELASALRVANIVPVEVMENVDVDNNGLLGVLVNMKDYVLGADRGGQISMFDDFDIDYNQYKYLIETRCSGALTKPKSALVFWRATGTEATPTAPTFVQLTNTITIPAATGVTYLLDDVPVAAGAHVITEDAVVEATADTGHYFPANTTTEWTFTFVVAG